MPDHEPTTERVHLLVSGSKLSDVRARATLPTTHLELAMRPTAAATIMLGLAITACSGKSAPGPLGSPVDLRGALPDSLQSETAPDSVYHQRITVGPDSAAVELSWTMFQHGSGRYLASVSGRLLAVAPYDSITLGGVSRLRNVGSKFEHVESGKIQVRWFKSAFMHDTSGSIGFTFDALGRGGIDGTLPQRSR